MEECLVFRCCIFERYLNRVNPRPVNVFKRGPIFLTILGYDCSRLLLKEDTNEHWIRVLLCEYLHLCRTIYLQTAGISKSHNPIYGQDHVARNMLTKSHNNNLHPPREHQIVPPKLRPITPFRLTEPPSIDPQTTTPLYPATPLLLPTLKLTPSHRTYIHTYKTPSTRATHQILHYSYLEWLKRNIQSRWRRHFNNEKL